MSLRSARGGSRDRAPGKVANGARARVRCQAFARKTSSVDLRVDRLFRVFRNHTEPYIDPKKPLEDLTELVEIPEGEAFVLHPGEFVLGSTLERVALPEDLVARLEGKSSLGRLGLLIHSSLPGSEPVLVRRDGTLQWIAIEDLVRKRLDADVVAFDPETFEVSYHQITGWYEGPEDRIFEVHIPMEDVVEFKGGKKVTVPKKVFPGYILVRMTLDDDSWYAVRNTPGVTGFVAGNAQKPTPLSRREVERFLGVQEEEEKAKPRFKPEWEVGEQVRVVTGPFADFNGVIEDMNVDQQKIVVLVNIFGRDTPVELGFEDIQKS